jgi:hypothetical protein
MVKAIPLAALVLCSAAAHAAVPAYDLALAKRTVSAVEQASMSLTTAVRQGDMKDFRRFITGPVEAPLDAIAKLPQARRMELIQCVAAGNEFVNRAEDSMKARQVKPANSLEREALAGCKATK